MKQIISKIKDTIVEKKAESEVRKAQERKRRFMILSGSIEPIATHYALQQGEQIYFQFKTKRIADIEYIESHTKGGSKKKGVIRRAVVGDILLGPIGAVIGGATAGSKTHEITTQKRVNRIETIDEGDMLFTNTRLLFIGKEIVSIPYEEVISVHFINETMEIKYPGMEKGEGYLIDQHSDIELYYKGVMRHIGRDTTKPKESDIEGIKESSSTDGPWYTQTNGVWIMLTVFFALVFIGYLASSNSTKNIESQQSSQEAVVNITKAPVATENPTTTAYKTKIKKIIDQFKAEDALLDADRNTSNYKNDPAYLHADKVYSDLDQQVINISPVPEQYKGYNTFLTWITDDMSSSLGTMTHGDDANGFPKMTVKTCEDDIKIAEKIKPTYPTEYVDSYSGYGEKIDELRNLSVGKL